MLKKLRGNAGFTLLEVLAVVALLGVLGAMLLPSLDSAAGRAKNARLESDLGDEYIAKGKKFEDATGTELVYTPSGDKLTYTLKGRNADGEQVTSDGSSDAEE